MRFFVILASFISAFYALYFTIEFIKDLNYFGIQLKWAELTIDYYLILVTPLFLFLISGILILFKKKNNGYLIFAISWLLLALASWFDYNYYFYVSFNSFSPTIFLIIFYLFFALFSFIYWYKKRKPMVYDDVLDR
jgi:hypothetical protein